MGMSCSRLTISERAARLDQPSMASNLDAAPMLAGSQSVIRATMAPISVTRSDIGLALQLNPCGCQDGQRMERQPVRLSRLDGGEARCTVKIGRGSIARG